MEGAVGARMSPPRALLRPRAVLAIQMPTTFCPPAPVAQPPVSVSILHEPLSPSTTKNPLPAMPASILDFPRGEGLPHALGNLRSVFFLSQSGDHHSHCHLGTLHPPSAQPHWVPPHPGPPRATPPLLHKGEQIPPSPRSPGITLPGPRGQCQPQKSPPKHFQQSERPPSEIPPAVPTRWVDG